MKSLNQKSKLRRRSRTLDPRVLRWSAKVRKRDRNKCKWCGRPGDAASHIIPRARMRTRYVLENGWCSCTECHTKYDSNKRFRRIVINILIDKVIYNKLKEIADGKKKPADYGFTEVN